MSRKGSGQRSAISGQMTDVEATVRSTDLLGSPPVLDVCCGSRMFWFDRKDRQAIFMDKRCETIITDSRQGHRRTVVAPDVLGDFTNLPFPDNAFACVIFDPPHFARNGKKSWIAKKYGTLKGNWREEIRRGFSECFRVLKPHGTLIFKWNDGEVAVTDILALTPERPLVGNRYGKHFKSHWIVFLKPNAEIIAAWGGPS